MNRNLLIVYGALRSGTTIVRLMLDSNPHIKCPGESDFLFDYLDLDHYGRPTLNIELLEQDRVYNMSSARVDVTLSAVDAIDAMISQLGGSACQSTVLMLHRGLAKAMRLYPHTTILHILRDPRDVARSSVGMGWAGNVYHGVEHWIETELEWDIVIQNCPPSRISTLRYEDLVFHPKYHLNRISDFFGIPFDGKMIRYFEDSTYDAPDPSLVQQWKCQHSPRELALIEGRVGELLISRGYDSSGYDPIRPTSAERISLWFRNKLAVWNILLSRYGLVDSVLLALARHLNLPSLSCNARKRMDAKTVKYLR